MTSTQPWNQVARQSLGGSIKSNDSSVINERIKMTQSGKVGQASTIFHNQISDISNLSDQSLEMLQQQQIEAVEAPVTEVTGQQLCCLQINSIMLKRFLIFKRDYKSFISQIVIPLLTVLIGLAFVNRFNSGTDRNFLEQNISPEFWFLPGQNFDYASPMVSFVDGDFRFFQKLESKLKNQAWQTSQKYEGKNLAVKFSENCQCPSETNNLTFTCRTSKMDLLEPATNKIFMLDMHKMIDKYENYHNFWLSNHQNLYDLLPVGFELVFNNNLEILSSTPNFPTWLNNSKIINQKLIRIHYNGYFTQAIPGFVNLLNSKLIGDNYGIKTFNQPITNIIDPAGEAGVEIFSLITAVTLSYYAIMGLSFLMSSFVVFLVAENLNGMKHLQILSGVHLPAYWLGNFLVDWSIYVIASCLIFSMFYGFEITAFINETNRLCFFQILLAYGLVSIPLTYHTYKFFKNAGSAYSLIVGMNIILAMIFFILIVVDKFAAEPGLELEAENFHYFDVLRLVPHFAFTEVMTVLSQHYFETELLRQISGENYVAKSPFEFEIAGSYFLIWLLEAILLSALLLYLEGYTKSRDLSVQPEPLNQNEPASVIQERINATSYIGQPLIVENLQKDYLTQQNISMSKSMSITDTFCSLFKFGETHKVRNRAVANLTFTVNPAKCFGLLGINGAGKSTTFKAITGQLMPDYGDIKIEGQSIYDQLANQEASSCKLGYCPQTHALNDLLTVEEHLILFQKIRGLNHECVKLASNLRKIAKIAFAF